MHNQRDIRRIIDDMVETLTVKEARKLIEASDDEILRQILKEIIQYVCGLKKANPPHD